MMKQLKIRQAIFSNKDFSGDVRHLHEHDHAPIPL